MEFLDDLLNPPESEEESDSQPTHGTSDQTGGTAAQPDRLSHPTPVQDEEAWTDLLEGVALDDPTEAEPSKAKQVWGRRARGKGLSASQKVMLGILGLVVVGIWAVIIVLVSRSSAARETDTALSQDGAEITVVSDVDVTPVLPEPNQGDPDADTEDEAEVEAEPEGTATPEPPPTATPPIFTALDRQIQDNPDDIELYLQRAEAYITLGAYQAALADLEIAKGLDKTRAGIYVSEGWTHFYTGLWQRAEEAFNTAVSLNQDLPEAHFGLGQTLFYRGRYKEAASEFDWAAEINPQNAEAEAWLGISAAKLQDKEEAYGAVGRAISQTNALPIVYIAQSWARRTESPPDIDGTQADLLYAQNLESNDFMTLNALAEFYVGYRPERLAEAELLASYAYNWATNDVERAVALQTLGGVYLQQDRNVDAERVFMEAVDLISRDGEILLVGLAEDLAKAKE
jgi:tetratricopeptide (TPR) repeat protein